MLSKSSFLLPPVAVPLPLSWGGVRAEEDAWRQGLRVSVLSLMMQGVPVGNWEAREACSMMICSSEGFRSEARFTEARRIHADGYLMMLKYWTRAPYDWMGGAL